MTTEHKNFCLKVLQLVEEYAELARLKNKVLYGESVTDEEIASIGVLSKSLSVLMKEIEYLEQLQGYECVGFPFMEDANFNGFSIKNGELEGDIENAYLIAEPWFCDFILGTKTSESDCFKFFIAAFITYMTDMLCPDILEEVKRREIVAGNYVA